MTPPSPLPWPLRHLLLTLSVGLLAVLAGLYLLSNGIRTEVSLIVTLLFDGDIAALRDAILAYGAAAPGISVLLMVLQAIIAPIPASLIMVANGLAFGTLGGSLVSLTGQLVASIVCFGLSRIVGRTVVERLVSRQALTVADTWFNRWGIAGIIVLRMIPGPGFDAVSYASGLTRMRVGPFLVATALGSLPQIVLYAFLGDRAPQHLGILVVVTLAILAGLGLIAFVRSRRDRPAGIDTARPAATTVAAPAD